MSELRRRIEAFVGYGVPAEPGVLDDILTETADADAERDRHAEIGRHVEALLVRGYIALYYHPQFDTTWTAEGMESENDTTSVHSAVSLLDALRELQKKTEVK